MCDRRCGKGGRTTTKHTMLDTDASAIRENPPKTDMNRLQKFRKPHNLEMRKLNVIHTEQEWGGGGEREAIGI